MTINKSERIARWDNLKFVLILLVVFGHTMQYFLDMGAYSTAARGIYLFIYSFHMPAFMFVGGMFARHAIAQHRYESVLEFLLIYVVMKFLENIGRVLSGSDINFHFLWEAGPGWFALAMAVFILATMFLQRYDWRYVIAIALFVGCVAGLDTHFGDHFASMRICVFYPVFLAGFYARPEFLSRLSLRLCGAPNPCAILKVASLAVLGSMFAICMIFTDCLWPLIRLFKGKYEYADMGLGIEGVLARFACYVLWAVLILAIAFAVSGRRSITTWLGSRTMAIFVWHPVILMIIFKALRGAFLLTNAAPHLYVICALCIGGIVAVATAYLPQLRVSKKLRKRD